MSTAPKPMTVTSLILLLYKVSLLTTALVAPNVATATRLTKAGQLLLQKGKETLVSIGIRDEIRLDNIKDIMESCIKKSHDPVPIAYSALASVQHEERVAHAASNLYRALRALDRKHDKDYAYSFLTSVIENHELDLERVYRLTYWDSLLDIVYPGQTTEIDLDPKIYFYEETETVALTSDMSSLHLIADEAAMFFKAEEIRDRFVDTGVLIELDDTVRKALTHYHLPSEEDEIFTGLVGSLRAYSNKHLQRQETGKRSSVEDSIDDALAYITNTELDDSLIKHEEGLQQSASLLHIGDFDLDPISSLSRLYARVELFSDEPQIYQELRWQYLRVYQHSLNLRRSSELLKLIGVNAIPHPNFEQIRRHYHLQQLVGRIVDERLDGIDNLPDALEYVRNHNMSGLNAKEINAYIHDGTISVTALSKLKSRLKDLTLNARQSNALEQIEAAAITGHKISLEYLVTTTIEAIGDAITVANNVYIKSDDAAFNRTVLVLSNLRREIEDGKVTAKTIASAKEIIQDLATKVSDVEAKGLQRILKNIETYTNN